MSDERPKSAYELAMERLRQKDRDLGEEQRPLSDEQRAQLSEVRRFYEAKLAEMEILHRSSRLKVREADELETLEEQYRGERERLSHERDAKLDAIRQKT